MHEVLPELMAWWRDALGRERCTAARMVGRIHHEQQRT